MILTARSFFLALTLLLPLVQAQTVFAQFSPALRLESLPDELMRKVVAAGLPETAWGVVVMPLPSPSVMGPVVTAFGLNAEQPMNPASVMKLVTTRAALGVLGPGYRHQTRIATTGRLEGGVLSGDVFFQGGGDPKLVVEDLWRCVFSRRRRS